MNHGKSTLKLLDQTLPSSKQTTCSLSAMDVALNTLALNLNPDNNAPLCTSGIRRNNDAFVHAVVFPDPLKNGRLSCSSQLRGPSSQLSIP